MINQERLDAPQDDAENFDLSSFYRKNYTAREKQQSIFGKITDPSDETKTDAMINSINNMHN